MKLQIVNPEAGPPKADLIEPTSLGYLYVAAAVRPGALPVVLPSTRRSSVLKELKQRVRDVERLEQVVHVDTFRAIVRPPTRRFSSHLQRASSRHAARFDVMVLIQTRSPEEARELRRVPACRALLEFLHSAADDVYVIAARNARRIADVDTTRSGLFLFNHFVAEEAEVMLELWDYLAGWYTTETGLDNSVALVPLEGERSDYALVNWARWDSSPLRHFWSQLAKRGFWRYVTTNLDANHAGAMPVYCRLV
jgi:hypothetical protein